MGKAEKILALPNDRRRETLSISDALYQRINELRKCLEARFRINLGDEDLIAYFCEKALERMEEWERRTRPPRQESEASGTKEA